MRREIRVTGKGIMHIKPDMIRLAITIGSACPEYEAAVCKSAQDTAVIRDAIKKAGLAGEDLKTASFRVDAEYESSCTDNRYIREFKGYRYVHRMEVCLADDHVQLGRILKSLSSSGVPAEFEIGYTVSDPEAVKTELLAKAVQDAGRKASLLAEAANLQLGEVISIDYSWQEMRFEQVVSGIKGYDSDQSNEIINMEVHPKDIDAEDTVTVVWEIAGTSVRRTEKNLREAAKAAFMKMYGDDWKAKYESIWGDDEE